MIRFSKFIVITLLAILFLHIPLQSQLKFAGISVSGVYTLNNTETSGFPNYPLEDLIFTPQNKINFDFNLFIEYQLYEGIFAGLEFGYYQSETIYSGLEPVRVIVEDMPVDGTIRHKLSAYVKWLYPSLYIGYSYKSLSLSAGNKFYFDISNVYYQNQTIIEPDIFIFINPNAQSSLKIDKINSPVYMPFVRFTYDIGKDLFNSTFFSTQLDLEYSFAINTIAEGYNIKSSNIKFGVNVGFDFSKQKSDLTIIRDTIYKRDTTLLYSFDADTTSLTLLSSKSTEEVSKDVPTLHIVTIEEKYLLETPKPSPVLNGELRTVFVSKDNIEMDNWRISYKEEIINKSILNLNSKVIIDVDTISFVDIPTLRFYPSVLSEAGIDSLIINIFQDNQLLKTIVKTKKTPDFIDLRIDSLIDFEKSQEIDYDLILVDQEGQRKKTTSGKINFKIKASNKIDRREVLILDLDLPVNQLSEAVTEFIESHNFTKLFIDKKSVSKYSIKIETIKNSFDFDIVSDFPRNMIDDKVFLLDKNSNRIIIERR